MMSNKLKAGIFVLVIAVIVIAGYFSFRPFREGISGKQIKLTIGIATPNPYVAPAWIAESKEFFRDEGLEAEIKAFGSGPLTLTAMLETGGPDVVLLANLPIVFKSFVSDTYAIFAGYGRNNDFNIFLAREDRGIKAPTDLKGRKVGVVKGTTAHYFLGLWLKANKLALSDVEIVGYQKVVDVPRALVDGQVDAIAVPLSDAVSAKKILGTNARAFVTKGILDEKFYFVARKDFIKNNQDGLVRFLKAIERGNQFLKERPLESIDIIANKSEIDKITLIPQWDDYEFGLYSDQAILTSLGEQANWAVLNGLVQGTVIPDYRNYVDDEVLSKVKPEAVTTTR